MVKIYQVIYNTPQVPSRRHRDDDHFVPCFLLPAWISTPAASTGPWWSQLTCRQVWVGRAKRYVMSASCSRVWEWTMSISAGSRIRNLGELCHFDNKSPGVLKGSFFIGKHGWTEYLAAYLFIARQGFFALHFLEKAQFLNRLKGELYEKKISHLFNPKGFEKDSFCSLGKSPSSQLTRFPLSPIHLGCLVCTRRYACHRLKR